MLTLPNKDHGRNLASVAVVLFISVVLVSPIRNANASSISNKEMGEGIAYAGCMHVWDVMSIDQEWTSLPKAKQTGPDYVPYLKRMNAALIAANKAFLQASKYDPKWKFLYSDGTLVMHSKNANTYKNAFSAIYNFCMAERKKLGQ